MRDLQKMLTEAVEAERRRVERLRNIQRFQRWRDRYYVQTGRESCPNTTTA